MADDVRQQVDGEDVVHAATTVLVRDAAEGLEVLVLERHVQSDFAGGAYVFPGGKVDARDSDLDPARFGGVDLAALAPILGADAELALGLLVAAAREAFEEAGVLLATRAGEPVTADDLASPSYVEARERLAARRSTWDWRPWLADQDLVLDLGALAPWSWWVSPVGVPRVYDTRFLVAEVPAGQRGVASHDDVETTASAWLRPSAILEAAAGGRMTVIFPTRKNLEALAAFETARDVVRAARAGETEQRRVRPVVVDHGDGVMRVRHPFTHVVERVDAP